MACQFMFCVIFHCHNYWVAFLCYDFLHIQFKLSYGIWRCKVPKNAKSINEDHLCAAAESALVFDKFRTLSPHLANKYLTSWKTNWRSIFYLWEARNRRASRQEEKERHRRADAEMSRCSFLWYYVTSVTLYSLLLVLAVQHVLLCASGSIEIYSGQLAHFLSRNNQHSFSSGSYGNFQNPFFCS